MAEYSQDPPSPPPRKVPYRALSWNTTFAIPFGSSFFFGGLIFFIAFYFTDRPIWDDWILDHRGLRTLAQPVAVNDTDSSMDELPVYEIELAFLDAQGRPRRATTYVNDPEIIRQSQRRLHVWLEYDPARPSRCRIEGQPASVVGWLVLLPVSSVLMGLIALIPAAVSTRRTFVLYKWGRATQAKVIRVKTTPSTQGDEEEDRVMLAEYAFHHGKKRFEGSLKQTGPPQVGATIWIIYNPDEPEHNVAVAEKIDKSSGE